MGSRTIRTRTYHNPYPYNRDSNDVSARAWDYDGPFKVIRRTWHMKNGKRDYITSVIVDIDHFQSQSQKRR